ncbi:hypothetical protein N7488_004049 [Penicillium malachiteum]|nr:hypothetical protein N7488_004049 [Penicillium malachiteum]
MDNYYNNPTFDFTSGMPLWYFLRVKAAHVCHEYGPHDLHTTYSTGKDRGQRPIPSRLNEAVKDRYHEIRPGQIEIKVDSGNLKTKDSGQAKLNGTRFTGNPTQEPTHWDGNGPRIRSPGFCFGEE